VSEKVFREVGKQQQRRQNGDQQQQDGAPVLTNDGSGR